MPTRIPLFQHDLGARAYELLTRQPHWEEQIARVLDHVRDLPERPRVLDVGSGYGVSTFVLARRLRPGARLVGVDLSAPMIARAWALLPKEAPGRDVRFEVADATSLPFADGSFDLAVGHSFLYLVRDREAVLAEIRRVLAPGGTVVLMEPSRDGTLPAAAWKARRSVRRSLERPVASLRFAISLASWRVASRVAGRMSADVLERLFRGAGFEEIACHPTALGLGLHAVGRRPRERSSGG